MSDTPRTDAACIDAEDYDHCVHAQFARGLEREIAFLRAELQKVLGSSTLKLAAEVARARQSEIERLQRTLTFAQEDSKRLDWLDQEQRFIVRGTDFPMWKVEGYLEDGRGQDLTLRQAIDECMHNECPG